MACDEKTTKADGSGSKWGPRPWALADTSFQLSFVIIMA